jgi:hypothetical protein
MTISNVIANIIRESSKHPERLSLSAISRSVVVSVKLVGLPYI